MANVNWAKAGPKVLSLIEKEKLSASKACEKLGLKVGNFYTWKYHTSLTKKPVKIVGKKIAVKRKITLRKIPVADTPQVGTMFLTWGSPNQIREFLSNYANNQAI